MRAQLLSFSCALISGFLIGRVDASCYYPDGTFPEDYVYVPCSGDEVTTCCILSEGDQCLSNGLCYYPGGEYMFRGACTDKSWKSDSCFQHCTGGDMNGSYDQLVPCGGNRYCCYSDGSTCCNDDSKVFTVGSASVIKDLASMASYTFSIETPTAAIETGTGTSTSPSVDPTSTHAESREARPTGIGSKVTNAAVVASATSTSTSTNHSQSQNEQSHPSKTALIAGAIGGVIILIIAIALVWFLVRRRYRKKLAAGSNPQSFPMSSDGFQKLPDKSPRPVEVPAPLHSPAPPYQPPAYQSPPPPPPPPPRHNAVEIDNSYLPPGRNQWGQPVYEAPTQTYGRF